MGSGASVAEDVSPDPNYVSRIAPRPGGAPGFPVDWRTRMHWHTSYSRLPTSIGALRIGTLSGLPPPSRLDIIYLESECLLHQAHLVSQIGPAFRHPHNRPLVPTSHDLELTDGEMDSTDEEIISNEV